MQNFDSYDLIIDARSPREYEEDHIPGAINLPVVDNAEYAEVGTLHRTDPLAAYQLGARYSLMNIARHIEQHVAKYPAKSRILVYCFRGGKRSKVWFDVLDTIGYRVEKLKGGWKAYRRWVNEEMATFPAGFRYVVVSGPTGCGKTRLLGALHQAGAQVLDLEGIATHRGSIIGAVPGKNQPTQKMFDSLLLRQLKQFDPARPVWVESESKKIGKVQLPDALLERMRGGFTVSVDAPMPQRVQLLREDYAHFEQDPQSMIDRLAFLRPLIGGEEFSAWEDLAARREVPALFERLMRNHYDPTYRRSTLRNYPDIDKSPKVMLEDLSAEGLLPVARELRAQFDVADDAKAA
ncbi:tRNA 2-selenouridine(34) synthase MnmH [Noviherbaspirillum denitrificans]|uniref:tRNA 2-selenouridine synthase n=1 Tax=Noviherbaspirillum denitrificans TaxID=1968433 RepID=A0A254TFL9_9BURK|nr:tRNA 2-selenouridine(34) synthase MnmH [Noviherbaspirillum denitrificans]OWW21410.1 tRNA 2-selenouridine synthase [Noviherbaspirillum denitrificans]